MWDLLSWMWLLVCDSWCLTLRKPEHSENVNRAFFFLKRLYLSVQCFNLFAVPCLFWLHQQGINNMSFLLIKARGAKSKCCCLLLPIASPKTVVSIMIKAVKGWLYIPLHTFGFSTCHGPTCIPLSCLLICVRGRFVRISYALCEVLYYFSNLMQFNCQNDTLLH